MFGSKLLFFDSSVMIIYLASFRLSVFWNAFVTRTWVSAALAKTLCF